MPSVGRFFVRVTWKIHAERSSDHDPDPLPRVKRKTSASSSLQQTHRRLVQASQSPELTLGQAAFQAGLSNLGAEARDLFKVGPVGFRRQFTPLELRHMRWILAACSSSALSFQLAANRSCQRGDGTRAMNARHRIALDSPYGCLTRRRQARGKNAGHIASL
jgi:hypothetical protein